MEQIKFEIPFLPASSCFFISLIQTKLIIMLENVLEGGGGRKLARRRLLFSGLEGRPLPVSGWGKGDLTLSPQGTGN
jgi:hypothetical protein